MTLLILKKNVERKFLNNYILLICQQSCYIDIHFNNKSLNSKIEYNGDFIPLSPNGNLLVEVIKSYTAKVLNFQPNCVGKWARSIVKKGNIEKSVLDYIIMDEKVLSMVDSSRYEKVHMQHFFVMNDDTTLILTLNP